MIRYTIITATLMVATLALGTTPCEDISTVYNWSGDPDATPSARRAMGIEEWRGYALWSDGNGLRVHNGTRELTRARFYCPGSGCPGLIRGDYDWVLYNYSTCNTCSHGIAAGGGPGRAAVWRWDGIRMVDAYAVPEATAEGAYVFGHAGSTYGVVSGWPEPWDCSPGLYIGTALIMFRGSQLPLKIACLDVPTMAPQAAREEPPWIDAPVLADAARAYRTAARLRLESKAPGTVGVEVLNGLRLGPDHVGLICSDGWMRTYRITGGGTQLRLQFRDRSIRGYAHYGKAARVDLDKRLLITVPNRPNPWAELWSILNPENPKLISIIPGVPCCYAAIKWPYAWVGKTAGKEAVTIDITNPAKPLVIQWSEPRNKEMYFDVKPTNNGFNIAAFAYGTYADLSGCNKSIFSDSFESGDTSKWSETNN